VHPQELVRAGLRTLLEGDGRYTILVEVEKPGELAAAWVPGMDVVVLHLATPMQPLLETLSWVRLKKQAGVVVLGPLTEVLAQRLVQVGAQALLPCGVCAAELRQAIDVVARGGLLGNAWTMGALRGTNGRRAGARPMPADLEPTKAEMAVLRLMADPRHLTLRQIAAQLGVGVRTVETHRDALHKKFKVNRRADLVEKARAYGMV
jgi:two-component system nitrate/nitrite response regulator NarL